MALLKGNHRILKVGKYRCQTVFIVRELAVQLELEVAAPGGCQRYNITTGRLLPQQGTTDLGEQLNDLFNNPVWWQKKGRTATVTTTGCASTTAPGRGWGQRGCAQTPYTDLPTTLSGMCRGKRMKPNSFVNSWLNYLIDTHKYKKNTVYTHTF